MSLRMFTAAALVAAALPVASAAAAPDRTGATPLAKDGDKYTWTSADNFGAVYGDPVAPKAPHCTPIFACDATLIQVGPHPDTPLDLQADIVGTGQDLGGNNTLKDVDLHVYKSDKDGTQGELLGESTSANPSETVLLSDIQPGYYLLLTDWYLGYGHVDGTAKLVPTPPVEEEEEL
jgi:hypothetical protein